MLKYIFGGCWITVKGVVNSGELCGEFNYYIITVPVGTIQSNHKVTVVVVMVTKRSS